MIKVELKGHQRLVSQTKNWPVLFQTRLERLVGAYGIKLQNKVKYDKLSGQVLKKRSGDLFRSIYLRVTKSMTSVTAAVGSRLRYARIHEKGGRTSPHEIVAKNGQALHFMWNGKGVFFKKVNHPGSVIPARSYLESSKRELMPYFLADLKRIARRGPQAGD